MRGAIYIYTILVIIAWHLRYKWKCLLISLHNAVFVIWLTVNSFHMWVFYILFISVYKKDVTYIFDLMV